MFFSYKRVFFCFGESSQLGGVSAVSLKSVEESNRGLKLAYMALPRRYLSFRHTLRSDDTLHF